jgi:16S rRNA (uracil1498-N3)-methyltransferase
MSRFLVPPGAIQGKRFELTGSEAHHAAHVLRKNAGDFIDLFDGKDHSFRGEITAISEDRIEGLIVEEKQVLEWPVSVILYQALAKGAKWDWLIEKNCEIGVSEIVPVLSQRTIVKWSPADAGKLERWNRIALAASKQCGRSGLMPVRQPLLLDQALKEAVDRGAVLIPWEKELTRTISQALSGNLPKTVSLFIGPEGGWDPSEIDRAHAVGALSVRLGPTLLRTETAGLVAAALVFREYGIY